MTKDELEILIADRPQDVKANAVGDFFVNVAAVLQHLQISGWKVTKTSLYRHQKEGKILPQSDGTYNQKDVDKYARTFLKQTATGKRLQENTDELQRQKLEQELKNLRLKNERDQFNYDKDRGLYIPRERVEIELATRAGILDAGLKHWIQSQAAEWIRLSGGDMKHTGELISGMIKDLNEHINSYAAPMEFEVVIEADGAVNSE